MSIVIRKAIPSDLEPLERLRAEVSEYHRNQKPEIFKKPPAGVLREQTLAYITEKNVVTFVAEDANNMIGFVQVKIEEVPESVFMIAIKHGLINSLGVTNRFKRSGTGTLLMEAAEKWIRGQGLKYATLNVWEFNVPATGFYQNRGYLTYSRKMTLNLEA